MNKYIVSFELALKLKEIGFNEPCNTLYDEKGIVSHHNSCYYTNTEEGGWNTTAPIYDQVYEWFREKHNAHIEIQSPDTPQDQWSYTIHFIGRIGSVSALIDTFSSYEETRLAAIEYAISKIKK